MSEKIDILLFGASGYTGKFTIFQLNKYAKNLSWGVAGRNEPKLKQLLKESAQGIDGDFSNIPIELADVQDEESIKRMTGRAKIIINCCGPFELYGEVVVKSCIETETHYVDISGETQFITRMLLKYGNLAEQKGVYIVSACGYDCIPTDLGICFVENNFPGTINSVETYMDVYHENKNNSEAVGNYGTWASAVNFLQCLPRAIFSKPKIGKIKRPQLKPKLGLNLLTRFDDRWACFFPVADEDVVYRSQQYFYENDNKRPIQMHNYAVIPSILHVIFGSIILFFIGILGQFSFGRDLLLKYPEFFTYGMITRQPSEEVVKKMHFRVTLKCRGWSDKLSDAKDEYSTQPNKEITARVSGTNPGYGFTSLAAALSAVIILTERKDLPVKGGVYTPAVAFSKTTLIQQLQNNGVVFEVLSVKDL